MKTLHSTKSIGRSPLERSGFILITLAIAWFAVPNVKAESIYDDVHVTPFGVGALHNGTFDINFNYTGPAMFS